MASVDRRGMCEGKGGVRIHVLTTFGPVSHEYIAM